MSILSAAVALFWSGAVANAAGEDDLLSPLQAMELVAEAPSGTAELLLYQPSGGGPLAPHYEVLLERDDSTLRAYIDARFGTVSDLEELAMAPEEAGGVAPRGDVVRVREEEEAPEKSEAVALTGGGRASSQSAPGPTGGACGCAADGGAGRAEVGLLIALCLLWVRRRRRRCESD